MEKCDKMLIEVNIMKRLKRKIDGFLVEWKSNPNRLPLIIKGARQIGKTNAIRNFGENNYKVFIEINFALNPEFKTIFDRSFNVDEIVKEITLRRPETEIIPNETLIFFDEMQDCISTATSLKAFKEDGRYDVICSGSLMGINYKKIESNSVGNKEDYILHSMDFEEFLWAKGYKEEVIDDMLNSMIELKPLSSTMYDVMLESFKEYMITGGMPAIVNNFIESKNFSGILKMQQQILLDYEEDITKHAEGLDQSKILTVYKNIPVFLGNENKKFQITKIGDGARNREYIGVLDWLDARVGGGIFTKAADVGADLVGKVEAGIPEDDPRNPATIADNVGDNVGDVAGMGADLYESYVGSILATFAIGASAGYGWNGMFLPLALAVVGIICSIIGSFLIRTKEEANQKQLLGTLRRGTYFAAALAAICAIPITYYVMKDVEGVRWWGILVSIFSGLIAGCLIGYFTEYFTSDTYKPTQELSDSSETGAATVIIGGISLGMHEYYSSTGWMRVAYLRS